MIQSLPPRRRTNAARLILLCLVLVFATALFRPAHSPPTNAAAAAAGISDPALFQRVIDDVRASVPYYEAMKDALEGLHYPTSSVFNWRTPLLLEIAAKIGLSPLRSILVGLSLAVLVGAYRFLDRRQSSVGLVLGLVALLGTLLFAIAPAMTLHAEVWAGLFIALSALAHGQNRRPAAVLLGLAALSLRELAAPFCVVATVLAIRQRRWRETSVWVGGGALYLALYAVHVAKVMASQDPGHVVANHSWLHWFSVSFLLTAIQQCNTVLMASPWLVTAAFVTAVVAGCLNESTPSLMALTVLAYMSFFLVAGQPFNDYWGGVSGPTMAITAAFGPEAVVDWWRRATTPAAES
jgi:hypothetical protein